MAPLSHDLTVVIPTVNRPLLLARAVQSCFAGPIQPREVLVVHDDQSHVDRYSQVYEELSTLPVVRLVHAARKGPSAARNTGWRAGSASWVYFLDDDDYHYPTGSRPLPRPSTPAVRRHRSSLLGCGSAAMMGFTIAFQAW